MLIKSISSWRDRVPRKPPAAKAAATANLLTLVHPLFDGERKSNGLPDKPIRQHNVLQLLIFPLRDWIRLREDRIPFCDSPTRAETYTFTREAPRIFLSDINPLPFGFEMRSCQCRPVAVIPTLRNFAKQYIGRMKAWFSSIEAQVRDPPIVWVDSTLIGCLIRKSKFIN